MNNSTNSQLTGVSADDEKLLERIGKITRLLHNNICELENDKKMAIKIEACLINYC